MIKRPNRRRGIGLLEVVVVLAITAMLTLALTTTMPHMLTASRAKATRADMKRIYNAIFGRPEQGHYGFIGDLGHAPSTVDELMRAHDLAEYHTDHVYEVGMGWNGPYLSGTSGMDATLDAFGTAIRIESDDGVRIISAGPDGAFETEDDLYYPEQPVSLFGNVRIELDAPAQDYLVQLYYADNGHQQKLEKHTAPYIFYDVPYGPHAVQVWKIHKKNKKEDKDLIHQTIIISSGRGGIFKLNIHEPGQANHDNPGNPGNPGNRGNQKDPKDRGHDK